jgi:hypothetical protein
MTPFTAEELESFRQAEEQDRANGLTSYSGGPAPKDAAMIVPLEEFVAVEEPGAEPLLGDADGALIPEGADVMIYGDGGAGKTVLQFDLGFHLATGQQWLGIPVARESRLLLIENEGPRPLLRQKLRRKLKAWTGPPLEGRISVFEHPWTRFTFAEATWRELLADRIAELEVDVLFAGPLTRLGMDAAGTLQEVVEFMRLVGDLRERCGRLLTVILVHHENKSGAVSGAWEGAGDTLLHVEAAGNGHTLVHVQKARWASTFHHTTLKLAWTEGEGFELEGDRDYVLEVRTLLGERPWRTVKEIAAPVDEGGIGAGEKVIRDVLDTHSELFELRTGDAAKELGRTGNAKVYGLRSAVSAHDAEGALPGGAESMSASALPLKGRRHAGTPLSVKAGTASDVGRSNFFVGRSEAELQALVDAERDA